MRFLFALCLLTPLSVHAQWTGADSGLPQTLPTGALNKVYAFQYDAPNLIAHSRAGLHVSTDLGATWTDIPVPSEIPRVVLESATIHASEGVLMVGADGIGNYYPSEVLVTTDLGQTWASGEGLRTGTADFGALGSVSGRFYASAENGIWVSSDTGATWTQNSISALTTPGMFYAVADTMFTTFSGGVSYHVEGADGWERGFGPFYVGTGWHHAGRHFALGDPGFREDFAYSVSRETWTQQPYGGFSGPGQMAVSYRDGVAISQEGSEMHVSYDGGLSRTSIQGDLPPGRTAALNLARLYAEGYVFTAVNRGSDAALPMIYRRSIQPPVATESESVPRASLRIAPNPGPRTVTLDIAEPGTVHVSIYDSIGREVARLHKGLVAAGTSVFEWPRGLPAGLYLVRAETEAFNVTVPATVAR